MFSLTLFKPKGQELKERVLKNKEAVLDVMAGNIKGARQCEGLLGAKCIGQMCEKFMEFRSFNHETGNSTSYWRCAHVQTPLLLIEICQELRKTNMLLMDLDKKEK